MAGTRPKSLRGLDATGTLLRPRSVPAGSRSHRQQLQAPLARERKTWEMRILREPLVHFLTIGALLFGLYGAVRGRPEPASNTITVSATQISLFQEQWRQQQGRPPTPADLQWLVDQYIREEVLSREAKALGLDRDDTIVRRRLAQKMDFLVADVAALTEPSDEDVQKFFTAHVEQYREPVKLSFTHIYFNPDNRRGHARQDAERALARLRAEKPPPPRAPERGDHFMLSADYAQRSQMEVARDFGQAFAEQLFTTPLGQWQGPLDSGYGVHLVRIQERLAATVPEFETVRGKVKDDFVTHQRQEASENTYQRLREHYTIVIAPLSEVSRVALSQGTKP
jgi:peptidyl-prolyl cis-trans isomerase C